MSRRLEGAYGVLAVVGAVLPLSRFLPWLGRHGLDAPAFLAALFVNPISGFFGLDVIVAALVLATFILVEGGRERVAGRGWALAATFLVGVSCGLPLFLALRARGADGARPLPHRAPHQEPGQ